MQNMPAKRTTAQFVQIANSVHGGKYEYDLVTYSGKSEKVKIRCPEHGLFEQTPHDHLSGSGCKKCAVISKNNKSLDNRRAKFLADAAKVHGEKYNYSLVKFLNGSQKVKILCPIHGIFEQAADHHIHGKQGCPACSTLSRKKPRKSSAEKFIENCQKVHGGKYGYLNTKYLGSNHKVEISCSSHGSFWQVAASHLAGSNCPACAKNKSAVARSKGKSEFLEKARKVHGDKYDYSRVDYINSKSKIEVICPEHGVFKQIPGNHLNSAQGCPKCAGVMLKTTSEFISEAFKVHGEKYDYSKVNYLRSRNEVEIICREHGAFLQQPQVHLRGNGCSKCSGKEKLTTIEFISRAKTLHGGKYKYELTEYVSTHRKVRIVCSMHGVFEQAPSMHLSGRGCPKCYLATDNDAIYIWKAVGQFYNGEQIYKIGYTSMRLAEERIAFVANKAKFSYEVIIIRNIGEASKIEKELLELGESPQYVGHNGASEFRALSSADLDKALKIIDRFCALNN
ncbi:MAG: hypothetical protein RI923_841 [Pseudomonadota bacterium]|jgi:hypothetical protein